MVFEISQLRKIRKSLDMTQHQLAKEIGISQSMIAKIESGKLDPTYSYVKKIEQSLSKLSDIEEKEAKDIMNKSVITFSKNSTISEITGKFTKHNISQAPVINNKNIIGLITESSLLSLTQEEIKSKTAEGIMSQVPPIMPLNTKLTTLTHLLKFYPLILITEKNNLVGIVTKYDIIKTLN